MWSSGIEKSPEVRRHRKQRCTYVNPRGFPSRI
jgi:hypothetical protein